MTEENSTYSSAPFISHDGEDENGVRAEVKVVTGFGYVKDIEETTTGAAAKVVFKVGNTKWPSSGYVPKSEEVFEKVESAMENETPIHFRIETRRKEHVDRSLPMAEISPPKNADMARENTYKSLAGVRFDDEDEMTLSSKAVTNPNEDPNTGGFYSAVNKTYDKPSSAQSAPSSGFHHPVEPNQWVKTLEDGSINPGSLEITAVVSIYGFISEWERSHDEFSSLDENQRAYLTNTMVKIANKMQMEIWDGKLDSPDASLSSAVRARQIMFEVVKTFFPIRNTLFDERKGKKYPTVDYWANNVTEKGISMWKWAMKIVK